MSLPAIRIPTTTSILTSPTRDWFCLFGNFTQVESICPLLHVAALRQVGVVGFIHVVV